LKLLLVWPLPESDFKIEKQLAFRQAVAIAAGVVLDSVRIVQVVTISTRRRMLLSQSTRVTTDLAVKDRSVADAIVGRLTIDEVNTQLQQSGLPLATYYEISRQGDITPSPRRPVPDKSNAGALIGGIIGGVVGVALILGGLVYAFQPRSTLVKAQQPPVQTIQYQQPVIQYQQPQVQVQVVEKPVVQTIQYQQPPYLDV